MSLPQAMRACDDSARRRRFHDVMVRNTARLRDAGVRIVAGSDTYSIADVVRDKPVRLARFLQLTPLEQLRLRSIETPPAILPTRRIGRLAVGFEASALALTCDPLNEPAGATAIAMRLQQGQWIARPPETR
jgi:imidazolonepropionase-like amidohydrolase